jgi:hypothetical protein
MGSHHRPTGAQNKLLWSTLEAVGFCAGWIYGSRLCNERSAHLIIERMVYANLSAQEAAAV